jgi:hypothetical protein
MNGDRVLTMNDWYDGPRLGVAELDGAPHIYEREFERSTDEYADTYFLSPIGAELLALLLEDWAIWCRWHEAYRRGDVALETHPALPAERARHEELAALIGDSLRTDPRNRHRYRGRFETPPDSRGTWSGARVLWIRHDDR